VRLVLHTDKTAAPSARGAHGGRKRPATAPPRSGRCNSRHPRRAA